MPPRHLLWPARQWHPFRQSRCFSRHPQWLPHRLYSIQSEQDAMAKLPSIDPSKLTISKTSSPKSLIPPEELIFGRTFTGTSLPPTIFKTHRPDSHPDHMLSVEWTASEGWLAPRITPYQNFSLDPATSVLHYAFTCFEGMKAYKDPTGQVRLFRPDKNMKRINRSGASIALPAVDGSAFIELMRQFVKLEERFIPA